MNYNEHGRFINYFEMNGKKYYSGTIFMIYQWDKYMNKILTEAVFKCYDTKLNRYVYNYKKLNGERTDVFETEHGFYKNMVYLTEKTYTAPVMPKKKQLRDRDMPDVMLGWFVYIFFMAIVTVAKQNVAGWIWASIIFFSWRAKKKNDGGSYIEW